MWESAEEHFVLKLSFHYKPKARIQDVLTKPFKWPPKITKY